jgi:hypothetical protein
VVLCHLWSRASAAALGELIDELAADGVTFATVADLEASQIQKLARQSL